MQDSSRKDLQVKNKNFENRIVEIKKRNSELKESIRPSISQHKASTHILTPR